MIMNQIKVFIIFQCFTTIINKLINILMKKMHVYYKDFLNCISFWGSEMNYFFKYNFQIYYTIVKNPQTKLYLKHEKKN